MSLTLGFDTETTGLPDFKQPSDAPQQPHLVQLAAILIDETTQEEVDSINVIIKPDGWVIPDEVAAIHGITTERAMDEGVAESYVTSRYLELSALASARVGHNISFDLRIMRIALFRLGKSRKEIEAMEVMQKFCTMTASSKIMKMPPTEKMVAAGFTKPKPPKLSEAYQHFFGEELVGAHDALVDVRACLRIYFHLQKMAVAT